LMTIVDCTISDNTTLRDNGGATQTDAPLIGSPILDSIPVERCSVAVDQRGRPRPAGGGCDAGAVELQENER